MASSKEAKISRNIRDRYSTLLVDEVILRWLGLAFLLEIFDFFRRIFARFIGSFLQTFCRQCQYPFRSYLKVLRRHNFWFDLSEILRTWGESHQEAPTNRECWLHCAHASTVLFEIGHAFLDQTLNNFASEKLKSI